MATLNAAGIIVQDMARALEFYRLLGLEIPEGAEEDSHVEYTAPGGFRVMFDTTAVIESFDTEYARSPGNTVVFAFLCESPQAVDDLYDEVTALGHEGPRPPWDAFWGQRYATVRDPDGHLIDLFAPLD